MRKEAANPSIHKVDEALPLVNPSSHTKSHSTPVNRTDPAEKNHDLKAVTGIQTRHVRAGESRVRPSPKGGEGRGRESRRSADVHLALPLGARQGVNG